METHPLREPLHAQLMLALCGNGQRADALAAYLAARRMLTTELGVEPGSELQELHQQILIGTQAPPVRTAGRDHSGPGPRRRDYGSCRLAYRVSPGRAAELAVLDGLLDQLTERGTVIIAAVAGMAGVGKTALALYWAQRVTARFPDGQLYVNLRGFGPTEAPVEPGEAVFGFLESCHVPASLIPRDLGSRAALYRSILADRKMLVLLDNARDSWQVRPLFAGQPRLPGPGHRPQPDDGPGRRRSRQRPSWIRSPKR